MILLVAAAAMTCPQYGGHKFELILLQMRSSFHPTPDAEPDPTKSQFSN